VVPKAHAFSDEDEKTTIESAWEDEASTTVEQSEVAEKIRAFGLEQPRRNGTNVTSTNGTGVVDEPTVDDQRAHAAIAMMTPPSLANARLVVTQGNDTGQALEAAPGKTYTIGRAIDNDFVLTDIAVSRKHFDLRQEAGAWVLADRGSGNGTLINSNLEDQPFLLANGDVIEIGNTVFRFEQANAPPRAKRPVAGRYDIAADEEEPSTVAGKPVRQDEMMPMPAQVPAPGRARPKTVPPPAPLPRTRNPSGPPPMAYPAGSQGSAGPLPGVAPQRPAPVIPRQSPQPSQPPPMAAPMAMPVPMPQPSQPALAIPAGLRQSPLSQPQPQLLSQPPLSQPQHQLLQPPFSQPQHQLLQPPMVQPQMPQRPSIPPLVGAQGSAVLGSEPRIGKNMLPTTIPGQGPPVAPPAGNLPYSYPSIADMHKHGQMLVVGNGTPRDATSTALVQPTPFGGSPAAAVPAYGAQPAVSRRTKLLLAGAALTLIAAIATIAIMKSSESSGTPEQTNGGDSGNGSGSGSGMTSGSNDRKVIPPLDPAKSDPTKSDPTKSDPTKSDPTKSDPTKSDPTKSDPTKTDPTKTDPTKSDPTKTDPTKSDPTKSDPTKSDPTKTNEDPTKQSKDPKDPKDPKDAKDPKDPKDPKPTNPKPTNPKPTNPKPTNPKPTNPRPRQVAVAVDTSGARARALDLYRKKKFGEAGAVLRQAAGATSGSETTELKNLAGAYEGLGVAYNNGMSPAANPKDAFKNLRKAQNLDAVAAGELMSEIKQKLAQISPKAALYFIASKEYDLAFQAVRTAEGGGISNADTKIARTKLEAVAAELYTAAKQEMSSNPEAAKQKLRQIRGIVDAKSPTLAKATALLNGN
jgi:hypothetical protein